MRDAPDGGARIGVGRGGAQRRLERLDAPGERAQVIVAKVSAHARSLGAAAPATVAAPSSAMRRFGRKSIVNVEPSPSVLSTMSSKPIRRQSEREMDRPRPVPPYSRVVV